MSKVNSSCRHAWRWLNRGSMDQRPPGLLLVAGLLLAMCTAIAFAQTESIAPAVTEDGIAAYFSPGNNVTEAIIHEIGQAKATVDVQAYSFTSARIAQALLDAKKRGVRVRVVLDKSQTSAKYSSATFFHNQSVPCFIDSGHAIAHNKVMIIDSTTVITGSFNFTKAAEESNAENLLIIRGKSEIAKVYAANFVKHMAHAKPYTGPETEADAVPATTAARSVDPGTRVAPRATTAPARVVDEKSQTTQSVKVFRTASGGKYHRANCSSLRRSSIAIGLSDAKSRGLGPCSKCHPPE